MNCSYPVHHELRGWRAWEAASDLHKYHTPFVSDWEVDFLECLKGLVVEEVLCTSTAWPSCLMLYAAQPSSGCIL